MRRMMKRMMKILRESPTRMTMMKTQRRDQTRTRRMRKIGRTTLLPIRWAFSPALRTIPWRQ
jgi:hypothetical protein